MPRARRTALVTGSSAGLGAEFARQLAREGYDLVLVARRRERLEELKANLEHEFGCAVMLVVADLSSPDAPATIYGEVTAAGIDVDYLVNNAGTAGPDLLRDGSWDEHERFFQLMMLAVAHLCHLFVPPMLDRGFGRVVNVASVAGIVARGAGANYGPSKRYVIGLSEELMLMVRSRGVHVCALCPGFVHTEFHEAAGLIRMKAGVPGFLWCEPREVVSDAIAAVERGTPVMVSGRLYRWLLPILKSRLVRWAVRRRSFRARSRQD